MVVKDGTCRRVVRSKKFSMIVLATDGWIFIFRRMSRKEYGGAISLGEGTDDSTDVWWLDRFDGSVDGLFGSSIGGSFGGVKDDFDIGSSDDSGEGTDDS